MNTKSLLSLIAITAMLLLTACGGSKISTMSDEDISETMDGSVSESSGGSATDLGSSARTAAILNNSIFCGLTGDTTITATGPLGQYSWTATWNWMVNCTSGTPSNITISNTGSSFFTRTNFDLTNTFTGNFVLTDLGGSFTEYNTNGTSVRVGAGSATVRNRIKEFSYTNSLVFTNVKIKKSDFTIASGSGTAHCVGTVLDGNDFDRKATIVFNGDGTYTVTLDNGNVYTFNLK